MRVSRSVGIAAGIAVFLVAAGAASASGLAAGAGGAVLSDAAGTGLAKVQYRTLTQDYVEYDRAYGYRYVPRRTWYERPRVRRYYRAPAPRYETYRARPEVVVRPRVAPAPMRRERVYVYSQPAPVYREPAPVYREPAPVYRERPRAYRAPADGLFAYDPQPRWWRYENEYGTRYVFDVDDYPGGTLNPPGPSLAPSNPPGCYQSIGDRVECPGLRSYGYDRGYGYGWR